MAWRPTASWPALLLLLLIPLAARAQDAGGPTPGETPSTEPERGWEPERTSEQAPMSLAGPVDPDLYRVGPGDVLQLQLWGRVSRAFMLEIGPEGVVMLPGAGTLRAEGRSLTEVRAEILRRVRAEFRGVNMDLRLARPRTFRIYLTGEVLTPGAALATGASRVADVLVPSSLPADGSRRRIVVLHEDGSREPADLDLFLRTGDDALNPWLRDGDILNVPVATGFVYVHGAVAREGRLELGLRDSLGTLLKLAGDPLPSADPERALLVRFRQPFEAESLWFRLADISSGATNPPLRDGDRFYVFFIPRYHVQDEVTITGEVARPGVYPIVEGRHRLSDVVTAAGGFLPKANLSAIRVHRPRAGSEKDPDLDRLLRLSRNELTSSEYVALRTKLAGMREDHRIDWNRLVRERELDLLLRDGDSVRVDPLISSIRVDGEVRRPGFVAFGPGLKLGDYVRQVGGYTDRAWRGKVRVTRSVTGQTLPARNVATLDPGDLIWVPEKPDVTVWDSGRVLLTALAQIATVIIAIRSIR